VRRRVGQEALLDAGATYEERPDEEQQSVFAVRRYRIFLQRRKLFPNRL
jgi:hypothetical protein